MNVRMIDRLLKYLEAKADVIGYLLEVDEDYLRVCKIVTAFDFGDRITYEEKLFVRDALRDRLFPAVNANYENAFWSLFPEANLLP